MVFKTLLTRSGFAVFRYRDFRFFWLAAAFSNLGMWALTFGRLWLMHELTQSPVMVGLVTTASLGPLLLFSMWGGVVADRVNRLHLIRLTRALFSVTALLTGLLIAADVMRPWHLLAISLATGTLLSFDGPARSAMLPALIPKGHLASAISLYSLVSGASAIVGPALFASIIDLWGIAGIFFLIGAAYALTVATFGFMSSHAHQPTPHPESMFRGLLAGVRYLRQNRAIGSVILLAATASLFGASYQTLLPVYVDQVLTGGVDTYSQLLLVAGIAGLAASLVIATLGPHVRPAPYLFGSGLAWGAGLLLLAWASGRPGVLALVGVLSAARVVFMTMDTTLCQSLSSDAMRGRVMSVQEFCWGMTAIGGLLMGVVAEGVSIAAALGLGGGAVALATGTIAWWMYRQWGVSHHKRRVSEDLDHRADRFR